MLPAPWTVAHRLDSAGKIMRRLGFSIVELLVVVALVAMLVGLLIPGAQALRESARRTQCVSHLKQTALAVLNYSSTRDRLPSLIDPVFAHETGSQRTTSWRYSILPFVEESTVHATLADPRRWKTEVAPQVPISGPVRMAHVAIYQCPSTPGYPAFDPRVQIVSKVDAVEVIYDAIATSDHLAPFRVASGKSRFYAPGAWYGPSRFALNEDFEAFANTDPKERLVVAANLKRITDGLSRTVLVAEQAGRPKGYRGGTSAAHVRSENVGNSDFLTYEDYDVTGTSFNHHNRDVFSFHVVALICPSAMAHRDL